MKMHKLYTLILTFLAFNVSAFAQHAGDANSKLIVEPNPLVLKVGTTEKVLVKAIDEEGAEVPGGKFNFFALRSTGVVPSSGVLSDTLGNITGMHVGTYNLALGWYSVEAGVYHTDYLKVIVENWEVGGIQIKEMPEKIIQGSVIPLQITVDDAKGVEIADAKPQVTSSNPKIAAVDAFYQVRALQPGKVKIEASQGKVSTSVNLTVLPSKVAEITLNSGHLEIRTR